MRPPGRVKGSGLSLIAALTFVGDGLSASPGSGLVAGTRSGEVTRFSEDGEALWRYRSRFRPERAFWPYRFLETPSVAALADARDPATGREVLVVGTGSTSLNFLDGGTGALIEDMLSRYGLPDRIQASLSARTGRLRFLVGHAWLASGSVVREWFPPPAEQDGTRFHKSVDPMGRAVGLHL